MSGETITEKVTLIIKGVKLISWTSVEIKRSKKSAEIEFSLELVEAGPPPNDFGEWLAEPGNDCELYVGDELRCKGKIDDYTPSYTESTHGVSCSGKSKGAKSGKNAVDHKTGQFRDKTLLDIANEIDSTKVGYKVADGIKLKKINAQINQGESQFQFIERLARAEQLMLVGQADGSISLERGNDKRQAGAIVLGESRIITGSAKHSDAGRHKTIKVRSQSPTSDKGEDFQVEAVVTDSSLKNDDVKIINSEEPLTKEQAKKRGEWERNRAAGEGTTASYTLHGWRDEGGNYWQTGQLIYVKDGFNKIDQDMAIDDITEKQSEEGTIVTLSLVDPRAHGGKKPGKTKSDTSLWGGEEIKEE